MSALDVVYPDRYTPEALDAVLEAIDDLGGCGCCAGTEYARKLLGPDGCPEDEDGWINHRYGDDCHATRTGATRALVLALIERRLP